MIDTKKIIEAAERKLQGTDMFVVGCTCTPGNEIELLIDSDTSVAIEACAELSRAVEAEFDRDEEDFSLTVASAGIGSELKSLRQYRKLIGGTVEVLLNSGIKMLAKLDAADDEGITISYEEKQAVEGKKRKQLVTVTRRYAFDEIKSTKMCIRDSSWHSGPGFSHLFSPDFEPFADFSRSSRAFITSLRDSNFSRPDNTRSS